MGTNKDVMPQFETEEQEAEYWNSHSPLDLTTEPKAQRVRVKGAKDKPITIRLDSMSRTKLEKLAADQGLGPSTFARLILMSAIEYREKLPKPITYDRSDYRLEPASPQTIAEEQVVNNKIGRSISTAEMKLQEALNQALDGDWRTAISLLREAISTVPEGYSAYIKGEVQMVWSCIQRACVEPLLTRAEKSVLNWDYDEATSAVTNILDICEAARLPLDYGDLSIRILRVAQATCAAAEGWKGDVDAKLNRVIAGISVFRVDFGESINRVLEAETLPKRVVS